MSGVGLGEKLLTSITPPTPVENESARCGREATKEQHERTVPERVKAGFAWLPDAFCDPKAREVMEKYMQDTVDSEGDNCGMSYVSGPALKWAFITFCMMWSMYLVLPIIAYRNAHCGNMDGGMVKIPSAIFQCIVLPVIALKCIFEWRCARYACAGQVAIIGPFVLGPIKFTFARGNWLWFTILASVSAFMDLDLATNCLFTAKIYATHKCNHQLENAWANIMKESFFNNFMHWHMPFYVLTFILYLNMGFFQCVMYSLSNALPWNYRCKSALLDSETERPVDTEKCKCPLNWEGISYGLQERTDVPPVTYRTGATGKQRHRAAFQALAEGSRMILVTVMNWDYVFTMATEWRAIHVYREAKRKVANFVFFMVAEQMLQLQLQGSALALGKAITQKESVDPQTQWSLLFGVIVTCIRLFTGRSANTRTQAALDKAKIAHDDRAKEWTDRGWDDNNVPFTKKQFEKKAKEVLSTYPDEEKEDVKRQLKERRDDLLARGLNGFILRKFFLTMWTLCLLNVIYCLIKIVMVTYRCQNGWNMPMSSTEWNHQGGPGCALPWMNQSSANKTYVV